MMNIDIKEILPYEISDEVAHHLVEFFYNLAVLFEAAHLDKVTQYQKSLLGIKDSTPNQDPSSFDEPF